MSTKTWLIWSLLTLALLIYFGYQLAYSDDKSDFLIGEATHGHHQIELSCDTCHSSPFGGPEVLQQACTQCHADELEESRDDHPRKKFTDPRNAPLIDILDARQCISCHTEHQAEQTGEIGLTLPADYCIHCHQDVVENRSSHKNAPFDTCASAGCHNFHDNRALFEDFLIQHAGKPQTNSQVKIGSANFANSKAPEGSNELTAALVETYSEQFHQWQLSAHAKRNVNCADCHEARPNDPQFIDSPGIEPCASCHQQEVEGFTSGKHGMRLSSKLASPLSPMKPAMGRLPFNDESLHQELTCNSCHDVHALDTQVASVEPCLACHADDHSAAFKSSPHGIRWQQELDGVLPEGSGVSCATCHMPRIKMPGYADAEKTVPLFRVEHNQNSTLRPNEKMIRPICMQCHSLEFSIDALADEALIKNNFNGEPSVHVESVDWALRRVEP